MIRTIVQVALLMALMLFGAIIGARAADNVCAAYKQQKRALAQCLKTDPNSSRCAELSDFDWDRSELTGCKAKPIATRFQQHTVKGSHYKEGIITRKKVRR
jgi:hypothetical protein